MIASSFFNSSICNYSLCPVEDVLEKSDDNKGANSVSGKVSKIFSDWGWPLNTKSSKIMFSWLSAFRSLIELSKKTRMHLKKRRRKRFRLKMAQSVPFQYSFPQKWALISAHRFIGVCLTFSNIQSFQPNADFWENPARWIARRNWTQ